MSRLAFATRRTSRSISGPYQDVREGAGKAATGDEFFSRLAAKGVSGPDMRKFAGTFRANLVAAVVADDADAIRRFVRNPCRHKDRKSTRLNTSPQCHNRKRAYYREKKHKARQDEVRESNAANEGQTAQSMRP